MRKKINEKIITNKENGKLWTKYKFKCNYCGHETTTPYWLTRLRFVFTDTTHKTCPKCHHTSTYKCLFNIIHDSTSKIEKQWNKEKKWDDRLLK